MEESIFVTIFVVILGIINLIVFWVMASNIGETKRLLKKTNQFFIMNIELHEQQIKTSGHKPEYFISEGKIKIKDKRHEGTSIESVQDVSISTWNKYIKSGEAENYELVPINTNIIRRSSN